MDAAGDGAKAAQARPSKVSGLTLALRGGEAAPAPEMFPMSGLSEGPAPLRDLARGLAPASTATVAHSQDPSFAPGLQASGAGLRPNPAPSAGSGDAGPPGADGGAGGGGGAGGDQALVLGEFQRWQHQHADTALAVAAIHALTAVIRQSQASTMMELEVELRDACSALKREHSQLLSIHAACDLFLCFVTRSMSTDTAQDDLEGAKAHLIERGARFSGISLKARETIALLGQEFVGNGSVVLLHGFSRVVLAICKAAAARGKGFHVVLTEGGGTAGKRMADELSQMGIPVTIIQDCAVGRSMPRCDMVLLGADGVAESGGIVNSVGTFQVAVLAKFLGKPVYVAAESYKFARKFPLGQADWAGDEANASSTDGTSLQGSREQGVAGSALVSKQLYEYDYTPPHLLTLLFTDLGVLTPSAVSDELIQLYL